MGAAQKVEVEDFDAVYGKIAKLYDHAENIIKIAYDETIADKEKFVQEIEGLVAQIEESANTIAQDFSEVIENASEPTNVMRVRVNAALRKVLVALEDCKKLANLL